MAVIKEDDIVGYELGEETVCTDCATPEEANEATLDEIMTEDELVKHEDRRVFCDRCKKQIP